MASGEKTFKKTNRPGKAYVQNRIIYTYSSIALVVLLIILLVVMFYPDKNTSPGAEYEKDIARSLGLDFKRQGELSFLTAGGDTLVTIEIEVADDDVKRQIGMMFREKMKEHQGMFFIFPVQEIRSFWMRNTLIPLDMIFVNRQNEIVTIRKNTTPQSEISYFSIQPALYVIEVKAGFTDKFNINSGDRIIWQRFQ